MQNIIHVGNGTPAPGTFPDEEYAGRLAKLRGMMTERNVTHALFTSYQNINYYGDFLYCRFGRDFGLVVDQNAMNTVSANIDGGQPWRRTRGQGNLVYTDWQRDNYFRALQQLIPANARIGIEYDHVPLATMEKLKTAFPDATFVDIAASVMKLRMVKSVAEIDLIKHGAQVADIGGAACVEAIGVGVPEHVVALHSTGAMVREIARRFPDSELMDTWTWFQSGINTDGAHNPVTSRRIERGDILSLNCFPMIAGYYTALERTLFCEEVSDDHLRLWQVNVAVHRAGLELIKPGVRCCDIANTLNEIYAEYDLLQHRTFGYGHSFGVLSHYYGREAGLELREDIETVLEPGMVVSMEPMIMLPEGLPGAGGYREHDILVVTENGADDITHFPFGPEHNVVKSQRT